MKLEDTSLEWRIDDAIKGWSKLIDNDKDYSPLSLKIFEHLLFIRYGRNFDDELIGDNKT